MNNKKKVMMLEGSSGFSFFLQEALLGQGLADQVVLASRADQAIDLLNQAGPYDLVIIDLVESWEQGMQLGFWLSDQQRPAHKVIIISSPEAVQLPDRNTPFTILCPPLSLQEFTDSVRLALAS
ncbi:MAG: hypothetical protein L0332_25200 [Chloroflexi bacterium]|nr:hypothetical protein [Chloroflexota bacterium]MCI0575188.1 hypothetical protein [Chloroflexota bacterium]MCI0647130.1 hypothetical protein [Chloroflexota bacterium]MCI0729994.1 hypothetical protein [Chloroflexota bacterium]